MAMDEDAPVSAFIDTEAGSLVVVGRASCHGAVPIRRNALQLGDDVSEVHD